MPRESTKDICHNGYEAISGSTISSSFCSALKDSSSLDLACDLLVEEDGISLYKNIYAAYRLSTASGRFRIGPCVIASDIAAALSSQDCKGRECARMPAFDVLPMQGEGLLVDRANLATPTLPIIRILPNNVAAQWVAVSQDNLITLPDQNSVRLGKRIGNLLQGNRCLYCLMMEALRGPRRSSDRRGVCIVTSCGES